MVCAQVADEDVIVVDQNVSVQEMMANLKDAQISGSKAEEPAGEADEIDFGDM